jgi:hypothetical protein
MHIPLLGSINNSHIGTPCPFTRMCIPHVGEHRTFLHGKPMSLHGNMHSHVGEHWTLPHGHHMFFHGNVCSRIEKHWEYMALGMHVPTWESQMFFKNMFLHGNPCSHVGEI